MKKLFFASAVVFLVGFAMPVHAADQYSWRATFTMAPGTGEPTRELSGGPFLTKDTCVADIQSKASAAGALEVENDNWACTCDKTVAQQDQSCPGYEYQAANAATANTTTQAKSSNPGVDTGFTALAPIPKLTAVDSTFINGSTLANFFQNLYKYLIGVAAIIAIIMTIWGGLEMATKDSIPMKMQGKQRIYEALIGLLLVLSPVVVFSIINPDILNLSVNIPALDTKSGIPTNSLEGQPLSPSTTIAGCVPNSGPAVGTTLLKCTAPTQKEATDKATSYLGSNCAAQQTGILATTCQEDTKVVQSASGEVSTKTECVTHTVQAYCSQKVTAQVVQRKELIPGTSTYVYRAVGYITGGDFANACSGSHWQLTRVMSGSGYSYSTQTVDANDRGNPFTCPKDNPEFKSLVLRDQKSHGNGTYECAEVALYCQYRP